MAKPDLVLEVQELLECDRKTGKIKVDKNIFDDFVKDAYVNIHFIDDVKQECLAEFTMVAEDDEGIFMEYLGVGDILDRDVEDADIDIRKVDLFEAICEYIEEFVGSDESENMPADFDEAVLYLKELVGKNDAVDVLREIIGMTDEELAEIGLGTNAEVKIAVGVGEVFAIVNASDVSHISLINTRTIVEVDDVLFVLHKGETFEDSRKVDYYFDNNAVEEMYIKDRIPKAKEFDVTITRLGRVKVMAKNYVEAMRKADALSTSDIAWDDEWCAIDAIANNNF